jgi:26S proteasome regulatory subunit N6
MAAAETSKRIAEAQKLAKSDPTKAEQVYKEVLATEPGSNESAIKNYESALIGLGEVYRDQKRVDALAELVRQARSVLSSFAKAKTAKLGEWLASFARALPHSSNRYQCDSCSNCSRPSPTPPTHRSLSPSHA